MATEIGYILLHLLLLFLSFLLSLVFLVDSSQLNRLGSLDYVWREQNTNIVYSYAKHAFLLTMLTRYLLHNINKVSDDLASLQVGSWQHWADLLPATTNAKPDRPYQPTTQCISDCHIWLQNTPCTAQCTPTSHQERTPSKLSLLPRQRWDCWPPPTALPTVRLYQTQPTARSAKYTGFAVKVNIGFIIV